MKHLAFISLILTVSAHAGDCIPLTFQTLSKSSAKPVAYEVWAKELMPDGKTTPTLSAALESWNKHFPDRPLTCIYSALKDIPFIDENVVYGDRYLWIGQIPEKLAADPTKRDEVHSAILIPLKDGRYRLIHTIDSGTNQFFVELMSEPEFFARTLLVYRVSSKS